MSKHILIVGGGVIGLCTAFYCRRRGHQVSIFDRAAPEEQGCSWGNAGMIVPSHFVPLAAPGMVALGLKWMWNPRSPFYIRPRLDRDLLRWGWKFFKAANAAHVRRSAPLLRDLSLASRACYEEFEASTGNAFGLVKKGLLMLCKGQHAFEEEAKNAALARELGIPAEVLDARQTAKLEPQIRMAITGSVYFPKDCHLTPSSFMAVLRRLLEQEGVKFQWGTEVNGWKIEGDRIQSVRSSSGTHMADEFVLCGGAWTDQMARHLGLTLPMQAGKGYSLTLRQPRQLPGTCAIFTEARVAVTPMGKDLRFGGTMEIAGLDSPINTERVQGIIQAVPKYYPEFQAKDFTGVPVWCGLRPCSPDGLPYLGRTKRFKNVSVATGHAMMGLSLGPITGQLMAEILSDQAPAMDLTLLNPDRYASVN